MTCARYLATVGTLWLTGCIISEADGEDLCPADAEVECAAVHMPSSGACETWAARLQEGARLCGDGDLEIADVDGCACGVLDLSHTCHSYTFRGSARLSNMACVTELRIGLAANPELHIVDMPDLERIVFATPDERFAFGTTLGYERLVIAGNPRLAVIEGDASAGEALIRSNPLLTWPELDEPWCGDCACGNADQPPCP